MVKNIDITRVTNTATGTRSRGVFGVIVVLVIVFVSSYCGEYIARRMGPLQRPMPWLSPWWVEALVAVVVAILAVIVGQKYNVLTKLDASPRIPVKEGTFTTTGIIALVMVAVASLIGAIPAGWLACTTTAQWTVPVRP